MKKRFDRFFPWLFVLGDVTVVIFSILLTSFLLGSPGDYDGPDPSIFLIFIMVWTVITVLRKDYRWDRTASGDKLFNKLIVSLLWFLIIVAILWMPMISDAERLLFFGALGIFLLLFISIYRVGIHLMLRKYRARGFNFRNAVIIGKGEVGKKLAEVLRRRKDFGIRFMGYFDLNNEMIRNRDYIKKFLDDAVKNEIDIIYINEIMDELLIKRLIDFADEHYIKVKIVPGGSLQLEKNLSFSRYGDLYVVNVNEIPLDNVFNFGLKRVFDFVFSFLVTVFILSWMIPLVGLLIKLESKGPIFFIQERNGVNNQVFKCLKFRSMTPNDYSDTKQAVKNDPRVTRIGAFLRKTSLDEVPQFLNVLLGDMSIVGPRPHPVPMNQKFSTYVQKYNARHRIKPGITGLAQVKGYRGEILHPYQIRSRVRLDYFYVQNWSIWMDLSICFRTIAEIFVYRKNAY
jgi:putative colanic acid biosysnthesis UDP-glucose lipid carrier transferase